ncbi:MAG: hypothetical protein R2699_15520 [Acidimicrobiales bacterium]
MAEVGEDAILVHDETDPGLAFQLSRLASGPHTPTPIGVFRRGAPRVRRAGERPIAAAQAKAGPGDLQQLLLSGATWTVS